MIALLRRYYTPWAVLLTLAVLFAFYHFVLYPWTAHWGLANPEAALPVPGDGAEPGRVITSTRGVHVNAPAGVVWSWVVQLGQERAGFYSNDWLENLTLSDIHNRNEIRQEWQGRSLGDVVQGAGGKIYGVGKGWHILHYEAGKEIYLWGPIAVLPQDSQTSLLLVRTYAAPSSAAGKIINELTYGWMHFVMERGMLLGIKARAEQRLSEDFILQGVANIGWIAATLGMIVILFMRRRGWWWGLISLAYAASILVFTADIWSAMAGFLWLGVITAGFILFGRGWWKGLALATALVILVFVLASQPHIAFGIIFLVIGAGYFLSRRMSRQPWMKFAAASGS
jgi:hypothetical protein